MRGLLVSIAALLVAASTAQAAELRVLSGNGARAAVRELCTQFERATGNTIRLHFEVNADLKKKIEAGEAFDVAVLNPPVIDALIKEGKLVANSRMDIGRSGLGVAVRKGTPKPDISSVEAFKRALLGTKAVAYPGKGASGLYFVSLLDRLGISVVPIQQAGCCGAVDYHLNAQEQGLQRARRNIDAWWPAIEAGAEAIVQTASGCGAFVRDYGHLLEKDPRYAAKAARVSALSRDLVEVLRDEPVEQLGVCVEQRLAFHCPCTLQHALKLGGAVEALLTRLGFTLTPVPDGHLCCGSAGTYSLTQPELSLQLRDNRLNALESGKPHVIATANIGCQAHLDGAGRTPVRHWIEIVEAALNPENHHA